MGLELNFDITELNAFISKCDEAAKGGFKKALGDFLEGLGEEFLDILHDEIISRGITDSRLLLSSFEKGSEENVWEFTNGNLVLSIGSNVEYAEYVNNGHWTNPKGVETRFVPGYWQGERFVYDRGADTGMVLKQKWIDAKPYWSKSVAILEKLWPDYLDKRISDWLQQYFVEFL